MISGWIHLCDEKDKLCSATLDTLRSTGLAQGIVEFNSGREVTNMFEMLDGPMEKLIGYFNPGAVTSYISRLIEGMG